MQYDVLLHLHHLRFRNTPYFPIGKTFDAREAQESLTCGHQLLIDFLNKKCIN